jgi:arylsulfatase A-like enzyme
MGSKREPSNHRTRFGRALAALGLLLPILLAAVTTGNVAPASSQAAARTQPNIIVVETDDQAEGMLQAMPTVESHIIDRGVRFENSFVNFPLCCPSRATFLTGQYAHNHRVLSNRGGFQHFEKRHHNNNLAVWLQRAGYRTALVGKYLNGFGRNRHASVPQGWSRWFSVMAPKLQNVYDYNLDVNGRIVHFGSSVHDFKQDVFTRYAVQFLSNAASSRAPFFLWLTYTAPHNAGPNPSPRQPHGCGGAAKPAPRHAHAFDSAPLPMSPNFNEADVSDKPKQVRDLRPLDDAEIADLTRRYRCQLESLLSVDEGVHSVLDQLRADHELNDTYVIFTSDNGLFHGEHRVTGGKGMPYEESIRVPLAMRGPGIPHGATSSELAINADLAPTIVRLSRARARLRMDGRSLLRFARNPTRRVPRALSIEARAYAETGSYKGVRTQRYVYVRYATGESELYDLRKDPYELENVHGDPTYNRVEARLRALLKRIKSCSGSSCRRRP